MLKTEVEKQRKLQRQLHQQHSRKRQYTLLLYATVRVYGIIQNSLENAIYRSYSQPSID